ncbi:MAG: hypothetical protein ACR2IK_20600 [Chloroflexota bacterium]
MRIVGTPAKIVGEPATDEDRSGPVTDSGLRALHGRLWHVDLTGKQQLEPSEGSCP